MKNHFLLAVWGGIVLSHSCKERINTHVRFLENPFAIHNSKKLVAYSNGDKTLFNPIHKVSEDSERPLNLLIKTHDSHITNVIKNVTETNLEGSIISWLNDAMNLGEVGFNVEVLEDAFLRGSKVDAECIPVSEFTVQIFINPDLSASSDEYITSTIIHEYVHTTWLLLEMYNRFHNHAYNNPILDKIEQNKQLGMNLNSAHHKLMIDSYFEEIKNTLGNQFTDISEKDKSALTKNGITRLSGPESSIMNEHRRGYQSLPVGGPFR